jgi:hypothetical protein
VRSYGACGYLMNKRTRSTLLGAVGVCADFRKAWDRLAHFHRDCAWFWEVHAADIRARHRIARSCCFIRSRPTQYPRPTPTLRPTLCSYSRRPAAVRCQREAPVRQLAQRPLLGAVDGEGECSFHSAILTRSRRTLAAFSRALGTSAVCRILDGPSGLFWPIHTRGDGWLPCGPVTRASLEQPGARTHAFPRCICWSTNQRGPQAGVGKAAWRILER